MFPVILKSKMYSLITSLKNLRHISEYDTYTPLILLFSKFCLIPKQFPIRVKNKTFTPYKSLHLTYIHPFLAMSTMLLHLVKFLHWFIVVQWIDKPSSVENWKFILMAYCVILFALIAYGMLHLIRGQSECLIMLNSLMLIESTCRGRIGNDMLILKLQNVEKN